MSASVLRSLEGRMATNLITEDFKGLSNKLWQWRSDTEIQLMDKKRQRGRVLGFVKGLRLSAEIAYLVRTIVSTENLQVSWGHLINERGSSCSPECDIIIHRSGYFQQWNGSSDPIMNFKFIEAKNAIAVISCKSFTADIDKKYCEDFHEYGLKNIFLVAECCRPGSVKRLKRQAKEAGYKGFYYLYTYKENDFSFGQDENVYIEFFKDIKKVVSSA